MIASLLDTAPAGGNRDLVRSVVKVDFVCNDVIDDEEEEDGLTASGEGSVVGFLSMVRANTRFIRARLSRSSSGGGATCPAMAPRRIFRNRFRSSSVVVVEVCVVDDDMAVR